MSGADSASQNLNSEFKGKTMADIRIYVADLAAYNNGKLHGVWIDACDDLDSIQDQIRGVLAESSEELSEEFAIHDYEGFGSYGLSEFESLEKVHEMACFITEHPVIGGELLSFYGGSLEDAKTAAGENYAGCYKAVSEFAEQLTEETTEIPEKLSYYIAYNRMGRDMELNGDIYTIETSFEEVHIFWAH